jgi:hypothetical protein
VSDALPLACRNSERSAVSRQGEEEETQGGRQGEGDSRKTAGRHREGVGEAARTAAEVARL